MKKQNKVSKYRCAPKTIRQKRADEWADIEAMENRERKELDAKKAREREAKSHAFLFLYSCFVFLAGFVAYGIKDDLLFFIPFSLSFLGAFFSLTQYRAAAEADELKV